MCCLTYVYFKSYFPGFQFLTNIFPDFDNFSKSQSDSRDGDGDSQRDRHNEF